MRLNLANPRAVFPYFLLFGVEILIVIYISHNAETNSFFENKVVKNVVTPKYNKVVDWQQTIVTFVTIIFEITHSQKQTSRR